jgi:hypothetical protein
METVYTTQSPFGDICGSLTVATRRTSAGVIEVVARRGWAQQAKGRSQTSMMAASKFRFEFMTVPLESKEAKRVWRATLLYQSDPKPMKGVLVAC